MQRQWYFIASRKLVFRQSYLELTGPRSDADAASGNREQDLPDWRQPFTEGLEEGESVSSSSAGETIPPHLPARPSNKSGEKHHLLKQKSQELHAEGFLKFEKTGGYHKQRHLGGYNCSRSQSSQKYRHWVCFERGCGWTGDPLVADA